MTNIFYTFYHSDAHESILVLFISSYWLVHGLVRCRVHHGSHPALCLLKKEGRGREGGRGGAGLVLVICFANESTVKMCHVLKKRKNKKYYISAHSLISCHSVYSISCLVCYILFLQCWSCGVISIRLGSVTGSSDRKLPAGRIQHFSHKLALDHHVEMLRALETWSRSGAWRRRRWG